MTDEDFYARHLKFYFFTLFIGGLFSYWGNKVQWKPFLIYGLSLIVLSFIGMIFFCENK